MRFLGYINSSVSNKGGQFSRVVFCMLCFVVYSDSTTSRVLMFCTFYVFVALFLVLLCYLGVTCFLALCCFVMLCLGGSIKIGPSPTRPNYMYDVALAPLVFVAMFYISTTLFLLITFTCWSPRYLLMFSIVWTFEDIAIYPRDSVVRLCPYPYYLGCFTSCYCRVLLFIIQLFTMML